MFVARVGEKWCVGYAIAAFVANIVNIRGRGFVLRTDLGDVMLVAGLISNS